MAGAVLVNAVIVGVAGVVTLRPFFLGDGTVREVRHREVPALLAGPVILAVLGLVISLEPGWISRSVLRPAAATLYGEPVEVKVGLWHGVTPMLALSAAVMGIGALIFVFWVPIHRYLRTHLRLDRYEAEHAYDALLRRLESAAAGVAARVQHGDLRGYLQVVLAGGAGFVLWGVIAAGAVPRLPAGLGELRPGPAAAALIGLAGGVAAARARSLLAAMIASGLAGLVAALTFMMNGAPDLALTQFAVESLLVVLLTVALLVLPLRAPSTRTRRERMLDAALSAGFAALLFVVLLDMGMAPQRTEISDFFAARSYLEAFGRNVVNVILVDFRAFDTLGETAVIALSAMIAWSLLGPKPGREHRSTRVASRSAFILSFTSPLFFWLLVALSVVVLLRGHHEIGGGFVGGLTAALAFAVVSLSHGVDRARARLRLHPLSLAGGGLLLALASGVPGLLLHGEYLRHIWVEADVLGFHVKQGTTLLFDLGVYAAVLGAVLAFLFGLRREAAR
jgi:multicomponent Na+:H+ antiporter subunit A